MQFAIFLNTQETWKSSATTREEYARQSVVLASLSMVMFTNNAINLILYCVSGPTFRKEFINMMNIDRCIKKVHPEERSVSKETVNQSTL